MERHEIPVSGEAERWVEAVERGDEVVLTRNGKAVATVQPTSKAAGSLNVPELSKLRASLAKLRVRNGAALIRELRDASDH